MEFNPARPENMQRTDVRFTCTYPSHEIVYFLFWYIPRLNVCGTLHEGSNTFYMNLRTFPSIFELRGCLRLPTVACWLPYAAEAHPFVINSFEHSGNVPVCGTLLESSNTFHMNPRTFPSIFEQRALSEAALFGSLASLSGGSGVLSSHFDDGHQHGIDRSPMANAIDTSTFRSNIRVKNTDLKDRTRAVSPDKRVRTLR